MSANKVSYLYLAVDKFAAITKKIGKSAVVVLRKFKGLDKTLKVLSVTSSAVGKVFASTMGKMAVSAAGLFSVFTLFSKGTRFQDNLADLSAITGATGKDLDILKEGAFELGKVAISSGSDVLTAFQLVASAKPELLSNLPALRDMTKEVLLLKNASGIELADAANITAQALNIFGKGAKSANKFVNILAAGAKRGSSVIADTGAAMLIAGPGARAAGLSFLQLNAAIQTVAKGGIMGARAGTALSAILSRLREQGFDFKKLGLQGVFEAVANKLNKITNSTKRAQEETKIFGLEHAKVGLSILNNVGSLSKFEKSLKDTNIAQEQADIRLNTFSNKFKKLGIILEEKIVKLFLRLEPVLSRQVELMGAFFDTIETSSIDALADSLGVLVQILSLLASTIKIPLALLKGLGTLAGENLAKMVNLDFGTGNTTSISDAFSIGGKFLGIFGGDDEKLNGNLDKSGTSKTDINVNVNAPAGAVESVKSTTAGNISGLNVGVSMVTQ